MFEIFISCVLFVLLYVLFLFWWQPTNSTKTQSSKPEQAQQKFTFLNNDFIVLSKQTICIQNNYNACSLKFSFFDSTIQKIEQLDRKMWNFKMKNNNGSILFHKKEWKHFQVTEYHFRWSSDSTQRKVKKVCFHYNHNNAFWFNTFQTSIPNWPMSKEKFHPALPINSLPIMTSICKNTPDLISENLLLNSDGFAIILPKQSPLFVQTFLNESDPQICISTQCKLPYLEEPSDEVSYQNIKFTIVAGFDIRTVYNALCNQLHYLPKPLSMPDEQLFTVPSWYFHPEFCIKQSVLKNFCQKSIIKFTVELKYNGFEQCLLLVGCGWDQTEKYLKFDKTTFPEPRFLLSKLHKRGYRVGLCISPAVKVEAVHFYTNKVLFLQNFNQQPQLNEATKTLLPDFTNAKSNRWFAERIDALVNETIATTSANCNRLNIRQMFHSTSAKQRFDVLCFEKLQLFSDDFRFHDPLVQQFPYLFAQKYLQVLAQYGPSATAVFSNGVSSHELPNFVRIPERTATWSATDGLKSLLPVVLTCSLAGYSFLIADVIGGRHGGRPSAELYIRWVQATTFMPSMLFAIPPWDYASPVVTEITKKYVFLHIATSKTLIIDLARRRVEHGEPIIRPLWYVAPDDRAAFSVVDQFMLGNDLLVAPVLNLGQRDRVVYLPSGNWEDQFGNRHRGSQEITVSAPLDELPYFKRVLKL